MFTPRSIIALLVVTLLTGVGVVGQQTPLRKPRSCEASQIYYVDSGQQVSEVRPGINGGNGYQLNILGTNVDKLEVIKESYMASLQIIPQYTTPTSTKWSLTFAPRMGQMLRTVRIRNQCQKDNVFTLPLTVEVRLLDQ